MVVGQTLNLDVALLPWQGGASSMQFYNEATYIYIYTHIHVYI